MKLQIFSDLHADAGKIKPINIASDVDAVIVAGDVCEGVEKAFKTLRSIVPERIPILMVAGNHEFYRRFIREEILLAQMLAPSWNIHFLSDTSVKLMGVNFVGSTLWTDYCIFGQDRQAAVMSACARAMNDHRLIGWQKQPWLRFRPQEAASLHHESRAFLSKALAASDVPTVVIVHTGVHENSIHPNHRSDPLTGAFVSSLEDMIQTTQPELIVHGHVHHSFDYRLGRTRVICNPHGYGGENPNFDGALVIEVGS